MKRTRKEEKMKERENKKREERKELKARILREKRKIFLDSLFLPLPLWTCIAR